MDNLIRATGKALTGFAEFLERLSDAAIPLVPVSNRGRLELDAAIRKLGLRHPFIAEGGCGVYLPEDYFHLKPPRTVRMGRFTCIPEAAAQPAAEEMLETLAEETGIEVVALRGLSPRELAQNAGLPQREAELLRQRDFDEVFFFAGASDEDVKRFRQAAAEKKARMRPRGTLWSLAVGANLAGCVRDLSQLYQRSLRANPLRVGIATSDEAEELFPACDRCLWLAERNEEPLAAVTKCQSVPLFSPEAWTSALQAIRDRQL